MAREWAILRTMSTRWCLAFTVASVLGMSGCAATPAARLEYGTHQTILPGLDACDDRGTDPVELDPLRPVVVLVHGCNSSSGMFLRMAEVFRQRGQQVICFSYGYRRRIKQSAHRLRRALSGLATEVASPQITVIGHSQGGLVARAALQSDEVTPPLPETVGIRLVTISSPFNGIAISKHCGMWPAHVFSLGIVTAICQGVAGSAWVDIHPQAAYVKHPHPLGPWVASHLVVRTNESGSCLESRTDGRCSKSDTVFSLVEQTNPALIADPRTRTLTLKAGHSAVVGHAGAPPSLLLRTLEHEGILRGSGPEDEAFLETVYRPTLAALSD